MLRCAECGESFKSGAFRLHRLHWELLLFPNGVDESSKGRVVLQLGMVDMAKPLAAVSCKWSVTIQETGTRFGSVAHFRRDGKNAQWDGKRLDTAELEGLDALTIELELKLMDVFAKHSKEEKMEKVQDIERGRVVMPKIDGVWVEEADYEEEEDDAKERECITPMGADSPETRSAVQFEMGDVEEEDSDDDGIGAHQTMGGPSPNGNGGDGVGLQLDEDEEEEKEAGSGFMDRCKHEYEYEATPEPDSVDLCSSSETFDLRNLYVVQTEYEYIDF